MDNLKHSVKGASWLGLFKLISQIVSWTGTILVTRLLTSHDYGIMEMATVFTGYINYFVEFGIGTALVNKSDVTKKQENSVFIFTIVWGTILGCTCLILAPITANFYQEPEIYPITCSVGLLFIFTSIGIVPRAKIQRELRFKELGIFEAIGAVIAIASSVVLALLGFGVWALIGSHIIRFFIVNIIYLVYSKYKPKFEFSFQEVLPFIKFGLPVVISSSLYYVYIKADRFFGGLTLGAEQLGFYAVALQLAAIPVEKIVTLIQSVLYPTLSKVKDNIEEFKKIYLYFIAAIAFITCPIFTLGHELAGDLFSVVLSSKWDSSVEPFKLLLIGQFFIALTSPNNLVHVARGKPSWSMYYNLILAPVMLLSFWYFSKFQTLHHLAYPWAYIFPIIGIIYIAVTNREINLKLKEYLGSISHPIISSLIAAFAISLIKTDHQILRLTIKITAFALIYIGYMLTIGKTYCTKLYKELKR